MIKCINHIFKQLRIWKMHHLDPRCSIASILQLVYYSPCTCIVKLQKISILYPQKGLEFPGGGGGISHLLLIDRRTTVDLWRHKCAFLVAFNLEKLIIVVNSIKRIRAGTCLGLAPQTTICNNLTAKVLVKCIKWFSICASLKLTDLISLISVFCNLQDHKLVWDTVDTFFNGLFLNYALLKGRVLL